MATAKLCTCQSCANLQDIQELLITTLTELSIGESLDVERERITIQTLDALRTSIAFSHVALSEQQTNGAASTRHDSLTHAVSACHTTVCDHCALHNLSCTGAPVCSHCRVSGQPCIRRWCRQNISKPCGDAFCKYAHEDELPVDKSEGYTIDDYIVLLGYLPGVDVHKVFNKQKALGGVLPTVGEARAKQQTVREELFELTGGDAEAVREVQYPCGPYCELLATTAAPSVAPKAAQADMERLQTLANKLMGKTK